jgi:FAD/FMN-containing dehydrogenase
VPVNRYQSWGRYPKEEQQAVDYLWRCDALPIGDASHLLPFGNGRSYGDVCLNGSGKLINCRGLNRLISFDSDSGVLRCESGVLLSEILQIIVPKGWFLAVTPGTQFVTVGGAIANDVHGKNHHRAGTFGCHLRAFELLRSDGSRLICSPNENADFFRATIGGLGLTGVITWAEIQLKPINSPLIEQEVIRFANLEAFFKLAEESDLTHEYTVAWIDCLAKGKQLGKGLFVRGNHAAKGALSPSRKEGKGLSFPIDPPFALINGPTLKLFNTLYYRKQMGERSHSTVDYEPFFYPLDAIQNWNRIYGSKGFFQYQCAIPTEHATEAIRDILQRISNAGEGSFLAVLKMFGDVPSPGLLSFPTPGATLALDFPNGGEKTLQLLASLDEVTRAANGRIYPAKDARMSSEDFKNQYPSYTKLESFIDAKFSSNFWQRVTAQQL